MTEPRQITSSRSLDSHTELAREAYARLEPRLRALPPEALRRVNTDVPRAVTTALAAVPWLASQRAVIARALPEHPLEYIDDLPAFALAAWFAHVTAVATTPPSLEPLLTEATTLRAGLLVAAEALAYRNLVAPRTVANIRAGRGKLDKATDLLALATLFAESWGDLRDKTAVTRAEVDRAAELAPALLSALSQPEPEPSDRDEMRVRAFSLLVQAHNENRRAVAYVRWHQGDADEHLPSLFAQEGSGRKPANPK